jgi:hypothetical protein
MLNAVTSPMSTEDTNSALPTSSKAITVQIASPSWKRFGIRHEGTVQEGRFATIVPGVSITLHGTVTKDYDKVRAKLWLPVNPWLLAKPQYRCVAHAECRDCEEMGLACAARETDQPLGYARTFVCGDTVEFDSYNLSYIGKITSIGFKTVSVDTERGSQDFMGNRKPSIKRMSLYDFNHRNWDLDITANLNRNANWTD